MKTGTQKGQLSLVKLIFTLKGSAKLGKLNYLLFGSAGLQKQKTKNTDLPKVENLKTLEKKQEGKVEMSCHIPKELFKGEKKNSALSHDTEEKEEKLSPLRIQNHKPALTWGA